MPWELGYFDGIKGTVAVLPISNVVKNSFSGTEYLGIYYYIQIDNSNKTGNPILWVHETATKYVAYSSWLSGNKLRQR